MAAAPGAISRSVFSGGGGVSPGTPGAQSAINVYNALTYGAKGDGATNDQPILTSLANVTIPASGGTLYLPPGVYLIAAGSALTIPKHVTLWLAQGARIVTADLGAATLTINGPLIAPCARIFNSVVGGGVVTVLFGDGRLVDVVYPQWWGAEGDNATDDAAAIQAACDSLKGGARWGGTVFFPRGQYRHTAQIVVPEGVVLAGVSSNAARLRPTFADYAILMGDAGAGLDYSFGVRDLGILCGVAGGSGIWLRGTAGAFISDVYIEGLAPTTGTGIFVDGGGASNLFTHIRNVIVNHMRTGIRLGTSGAIRPTSVLAENFNAFCDLVAGSAGILIDAISGDGCRFVGGNLENCVRGVDCNSPGSQFIGVRFENCTTYALLTRGGNAFIGCSNLQNFDESAVPAGEYNTRIANLLDSGGMPLAPAPARLHGEHGGSFTITSLGGWINAALLNAWVNVITLQYRKTRDGMIQIRGRVNAGAVNTAVCQLPAGYRPGQNTQIQIVTTNPFGAGVLTIEATGDVIPRVAGTTEPQLDCGFAID